MKRNGAGASYQLTPAGRTNLEGETTAKLNLATRALNGGDNTGIAGQVCARISHIWMIENVIGIQTKLELCNLLVKVEGFVGRQVEIDNTRTIFVIAVIVAKGSRRWNGKGSRVLRREGLARERRQSSILDKHLGDDVK